MSLSGGRPESAEKLFMGSAVDGNADLFEYYDLWKEYVLGNSIDAQIAKDMLSIYELKGDSATTEIGKYIADAYSKCSADNHHNG